MHGHICDAQIIWAKAYNTTLFKVHYIVTIYNMSLSDLYTLLATLLRLL